VKKRTKIRIVDGTKPLPEQRTRTPGGRQKREGGSDARWNRSRRQRAFDFGFYWKQNALEREVTRVKSRDAKNSSFQLGERLAKEKNDRKKYRSKKRKGPRGGVQAVSNSQRNDKYPLLTTRKIEERDRRGRGESKLPTMGVQSGGTDDYEARVQNAKKRQIQGTWKRYPH